MQYQYRSDGDRDSNVVSIPIRSIGSSAFKKTVDSESFKDRDSEKGIDNSSNGDIEGDSGVDSDSDSDSNGVSIII